MQNSLIQKSKEKMISKLHFSLWSIPIYRQLTFLYVNIFERYILKDFHEVDFCPIKYIKNRRQKNPIGLLLVHNHYCLLNFYTPLWDRRTEKLFVEKFQHHFQLKVNLNFTKTSA